MSSSRPILEYVLPMMFVVFFTPIKMTESLLRGRYVSAERFQHNVDNIDSLETIPSPVVEAIRWTESQTWN